MDIIARKRSEDPAQEHLREHKAQWNQRVKAFIKMLIAAKKAMNGTPVTELGLPKGDIKLPLPEQVASILDTLASEYSDLTHDAGSIISEQHHYSEARRKPQAPKAQPQASPQAVAHRRNELVKMASDEFASYGSNMFSRLWTYVATPFRFGDEDRWVRKNLLQAAVEIQSSLGDIGKFIVSSDEDAIPQTVYHTRILMQTFLNDLANPILELSKHKEEQRGDIKGEEDEQVEEELGETVPLSEVETPVAPEEAKKELETVKEEVKPEANPTEEKPAEKRHKGQLTREGPVVIYPVNRPEIKEPIVYTEAELGGINSFLSDVHGIGGVLEGYVKPAINKHRTDKTLTEKLRLIKAGINELEVLIRRFNEAVDSNSQIYETLFGWYKDIRDLNSLVINQALEANINIKQGNIEDSDLQKFAQARFTRWIGRKKLEILKSKNYRMKLQADKLITSAYKSLNDIMNVLQEKNAEVDRIVKALTNLSAIFGELSSVVSRMAIVYNDYLKLEKLKSKGKKLDKSVISPVDIRDLNRYQKTLTPEEEEEIIGIDEAINELPVSEEIKKYITDIENNAIKRKALNFVKKNQFVEIDEVVEFVRNIGVKPQQKGKTVKPTSAPTSTSSKSGFGDVRAVTGGVSIPLKKFQQLIDSKVVTITSPTSIRTSNRRMPAFVGFESFLKPSTIYKVEEKDGRVNITAAT
jgi:hypothetical protein